MSRKLINILYTPCTFCVVFMTVFLFQGLDSGSLFSWFRWLCMCGQCGWSEYTNGHRLRIDYIWHMSELVMACWPMIKLINYQNNSQNFLLYLFYCDRLITLMYRQFSFHTLYYPKNCSLCSITVRTLVRSCINFTELNFQFLSINVEIILWNVAINDVQLHNVNSEFGIPPISHT